MLRLPDGTTVLSATDLTSHLACEHLFEQRRAIAHGERPRARPADDPHGDLVKRRGDEHERAQLERLASELGGCADISGEVPFTREALGAAAARTRDAIAEGVPLIFQAQFFDGRWQGRADFLRRTPSGAYEVVDTKLARAVRPHVVHQLLLYSRLLGAVQGSNPERAHVLLGDGVEHVVDLRRYGALHRRVTADVERRALAGSRGTYPEPTAHCGVCALSSECDARRRSDDHLSLVAGIRRPQREDLVAAGVATVAQLAAASPGGEAFDLLHHQAALQVVSRTTGEPTHRHLTPARARGYARLPEPDAGDVFFDLEGDPYVGTEGGVEYLWGWSTAEGTYDHVWAHDADAEKAALERFVAAVCARRDRHPGMHVFHYAPHEASKLTSLATRYATCEDEIDELLRNGVLVDLYAVVRQALQVGEESYSIKRLERHYGFVRHEHSVRDGGGSIVAYEHWLESGDASTLEAIRAYNEEDCRSTRALRDWLAAAMREEAEAAFGVRFAELAEPEAAEPQQPPSWLPEQQALAARLASGLPADDPLDTPDQSERRLLGHLLLYHYRESKPEWWRHFDLRARTPVELVEEREAIGCLRPDAGRPPVPVKQSLDYAFTFPPQEVKLSPDLLLDPTTGEQHNVVVIDDDRVVVRRRATREPPAVHALIARGPVHTAVLRAALAEVAGALLEGDGRFGAARSILRREPPAVVRATDPTVEQMCAAALALDRSHLVVQGPPGTGKTHRAARMIVAAMRARRRVGVTAQSHAAVQNLLDAVEAHAHDEGFDFAGVYKGHGYQSAHGLIESVETNPGTQGDFALVAGTAWLFARPEHRDSLRLLFVDEAGQFSLAGAIAVAPAADSLVLLGDPQQLPQVTQAAHPGASGASVLEHLLGGEATVPLGRGFFLPESWRMHPDVCAFVSERSYDSRLRSRPACARRRIGANGALAGAGLRLVATPHEGCGQRSVEEAEAIASACRDLLAGGTVTDEHGATRRLLPADLMVVAPYNLAVRCIRAHVPHGVQVGTVDRFQGREAPVVFFAMTCSSGEDVPRGLDFLFSRNRLNVAISRAQCLAILVANPRLLHADCRTLEAMQLVDGACRFAELATPASPGGTEHLAA